MITIDGEEYTVTTIGNNAFEYSNVEKVKLPSTILTIDRHAFSNCIKLTSVDLGNSVKTIETGAFYNCEKLTSITGYESVEYISDYYPGAFTNVPWVDNQPDGVVYIGKVLYKYSGSMPSNTSINVKEGTMQIYNGAFRNYSNLISVTLPNTISKIGLNAFGGCERLASISMPNSVAEVGTGAFDRTKWFESKPDGVVYIGNMLYTYKGVMAKGTSVNIKNGTTTIAPFAFYKQENLTSVTIPESVTSIGRNAFTDCI